MKGQNVIKRNIGQKSKFCKKILVHILATKICRKIEMLDKHRTFRQRIKI